MHPSSHKKDAAPKRFENRLMRSLQFPNFSNPTPLRIRLHGFMAVLTFALVLLCARDVAAQGTITVYPGSPTIEIGSSRQLSAYVPLATNTITWRVNDIPGGNATYGTITANGLYTAPPVAPASNTIVIKAVSTAYPNIFGAGSITITKKYPWLWGVSPSSLKVGSFQVSLNGSSFAPDSQVLVNGAPVETTYSSPTKLIAKGMAAQSGALNFAVRQIAPGAVTGNIVVVQVTAAPVTVAVAPTIVTLQLGNSQPFSATVSGSTNTAVTWSVNGTSGGSATVGTISALGLYTAPANMPASPTVTIRTTSVANPASFAQATVTLIAPAPPVNISISPLAPTISLGNAQSFSATVTGSPNTAVAWSVNGVLGGSAAAGTINASGIFLAPSAMPASSNATVRATSVANPSAFAQTVVKLVPLPSFPATSLSAARFLEQASFGPTPATLLKVQQMGIPGFLNEQFSLPESAIPLPANNSMGSLRQWILHHYTAAPDQLRQRICYALSQIVVTSGSKLSYADEVVPWLKILSKNAFGNYRTLLHETTISPSMGKYLDLANSMKPGMAGGANENYARELLQLFTIGLWQLNMDGSFKTNASGAFIPTYDQETVRQIALALTGWTYATAPGGTPGGVNWEYFGAPLEARPVAHDTSAKTFLGSTLPAGQTVQQDLDGLINVLMAHPNTAPFIATRLIRSLVISNPSGAYIQRVANVFVNNGSGVRGDLKVVVNAILTDTEARQDNAAVNQGRLKEPILHTAGFLRALNGQFSSGQQLTYLFDHMAQSVLNPPSVFSWFSPLYRVPKSPLYGPEFQIYTPTEATLRGNLFHYLLSSPGGDFTLDLSPFQPYGNDMPGLVEAANQILLYGRMPATMKQILITAATPGYDAATRIQTVVYLTALSGQYAVQY